MTALLFGLGLTGCASSPAYSGGSANGRSVFRVSPHAVAPVVSDQGIMILLWSIECLDPSDPDAIALLGDLPGRVTQVEGRFDPDVIATHLESLEAKKKLHLLFHPVVTVMAGERATIGIGEPAEEVGSRTAPEQQGRAETFGVGVRVEVHPVIDPDGFVLLDLDYRMRMARKDTREPNPDILTYRVNPAVRLRSGESVVLGGLPMPVESSVGEPSESVLLVVVHVCAIPAPAQQDSVLQASVD